MGALLMGPAKRRLQREQPVAGGERLVKILAISVGDGENVKRLTMFGIRLKHLKTKLGSLRKLSAFDELAGAGKNRFVIAHRWGRLSQ